MVEAPIEEKLIKKSIKSKLQLISIACLIVIFSNIVFGQLKEIFIIQIKLNDAQNELIEANQRKDNLLLQLDQSESHEVIEKVVRERLGLIKENDTLLIIE